MRIVWHYFIVGTTILFFDRFQSACLASPEWTESFNIPLLVHRHRITNHHAHLQRSKNQERWCLRLILSSNMTGTMTFLKECKGQMRTRSRLSVPLWAAFRPYPPSQGAPADRAVLKNIKMYVPIQDAFSKLLHIKGGRCLDFRACHDVGYQDAKFQKYRTCDKKIKRYLFESTFFWDTRYDHEICTIAHVVVTSYSYRYRGATSFNFGTPPPPPRPNDNKKMGEI